MNCAIHTDQPAAAYCRTCGKPLCDNCKRDVRGVIYCEDCIHARVSGTVPAASGTIVIPQSGPNPGLATVLSVLFPFGVAQVYNGQYAKGLAHLLIFAVFVAGASSGGGGTEAFFGIAIGGFYIYQIVDAYRSARAISLGQPPPDPFGLSRALATDRVSTQNIPIGAIILIGIGVLFLLQNIGLFNFHWLGRLWPLILIALGVRVILRNNPLR